MKICRNERNVLKWKFRVWSPEYIKTLQRNFISGYYSQNSWNVIKIKTVLVYTIHTRICIHFHRRSRFHETRGSTLAVLITPIS